MLCEESLLSSTDELMSCFKLTHGSRLPFCSRLLCCFKSSLSSGLLENWSANPRNESVGGLAATSLASAGAIEPKLYNLFLMLLLLC